MQQRPDLISLIEAVRAFLDTDVRASVEDRALRFRLLIASNLLRQVASELRSDDALRSAELSSLAQVLSASGKSDGLSGQARQQHIAALDAELAARIRDCATGDEELAAIRRHLMATLAATLEATDPRFDLSMEIE